MAENYVRHARELVAMTDMGFIGRFGGLLARVASAYTDLSADQVMQKAIVLHKRHGNGIVSALENGFKSHAHALAQGTLPDSCLLRLVGAIETSTIRDPVEMDHANERRDDRDFRRTSEILLALNSTKLSLVVAGIEPIRGEATFALTEILVEAHERDRSTGLAPENHRYVSTRTLTKTLGASELALRRRVERLRRKVAESYEKRFGLVLAGDALIQSRSWQGYRLNPYVRVVREDQIVVETRHEKPDERHETIN